MWVKTDNVENKTLWSLRKQEFISSICQQHKQCKQTERRDHQRYGGQCLVNLAESRIIWELGPAGEGRLDYTDA